MVCYFGTIENSTMNLNDIGKIVHAEWLKTFGIRPDMNLGMCEFVVMPNHFHAIIIIGDNKYNTVGSDEVANKFGKQSANLATIIRGFKAAVTRKAKLYNPDFEWQPLYHDHIIRTAESFENISNYIICNPENWENDRFFP